MGPVDAIKICFAKYATFSGRATRSEFWWFWATTTLVGLACSTLGLDRLSSLFALAVLLPTFAVAWRRMHDAGNSGALLLAPLAVVLASVYIALFAMMIPFSQRMAEAEITPETTIGELQQRIESIEGELGISEQLQFTPFAAIVLGVGLVWLAYLLVRPSQSGQNAYGPNPHEVTP